MFVQKLNLLCMRVTAAHEMDERVLLATQLRSKLQPEVSPNALLQIRSNPSVVSGR